jgi:hypothetical protein
MKKLSIIFALLLITLLSACSSTSKVAIEKKPLISDQYLLLSLLNRPVTQDQQMMLAFAKQRDDFQNLYFVNSVEIRGPKSDATKSTRATHAFSNLIAQDFNSVRISGPE